MSDLSDLLNLDDRTLWLMIGAAVALIFTIQAAEQAIDGLWPHERRASSMSVRARTAHPLWGLVALALLPGGLLLVATLAVMTWKDLAQPDTIVLGASMLGIAWAVFVLHSVDRLGLRTWLGQVGAVAPVLLTVIVVAADILLVIAFFAIKPSVQSVRDALPLGS